MFLNDYSPFGVQLSGRNYTASGAKEFRYGFQNQEEDDEIKGEGNSLNYQYRMHDPRLGRFFAIDPLAKKYPFYSPYAFSGNRVIDRVELEGLEPAMTPEVLKAAKGFLSNPKRIEMVVYVDQPGSGGDRDNAEVENGTDVGHTFIAIRIFDENDKPHTVVFGFYPKNGTSPWKPQGVGVVLDDSGHKYEVKYDAEITVEEATKVLDLAIMAVENGATYNLNTYNCSDFGLEMAKMAGEILPDTKGIWFKGGGTNPGDLGEDLRELNKKNNESDDNKKGTAVSTTVKAKTKKQKKQSNNEKKSKV